MGRKISKKAAKKMLGKRQVNMTARDLQEYKKQNQADAVQFVIYFSLLALRNQGWGKVRLERFIKEIATIFEDFNNDLLTLKDIMDVIHEETGLNVEEVIELKDE